MKKYDFLIVGAGLYGSVFAQEAKKKGYKCIVVDKRNHIAGNLYSEKIEGINVHKYGAHIFHTSNKKVWDYVNSFVEFNRFTNSPMANFKGKLYNLPFNMNTFYQLWGVKTPEEAIKKIEEQTAPYKNTSPSNLEEQALKLAGPDIYNTLIKGYTEKQWGREATEIPEFIIRRLPFRLTFDNNYFNDKYQGIPVGGYNKLIEALLEGTEIKLNTDFYKEREELTQLADKIIFTGKIDQYYDYKFGKLDYRSLKFEHEILDNSNFQGNAVVNYTEKEIPFTRIIEHKHFEFGNQPKTVITKEYPMDYNGENIPYYPINDENNNSIYLKYKELSEKQENIFFGGRLGEYKYLDMHMIIEKVLNLKII